MNKIRLNNMKEIDKLRKKLEIKFVEEKFNNNNVSKSTVDDSQFLDVLIVQEQKRRLEEFMRSKRIEKSKQTCN